MGIAEIRCESGVEERTGAAVMSWYTVQRSEEMFMLQAAFSVHGEAEIPKTRTAVKQLFSL